MIAILATQMPLFNPIILIIGVLTYVFVPTESILITLKNLVTYALHLSPHVKTKPMLNNANKDITLTLSLKIVKIVLV